MAKKSKGIGAGVAAAGIAGLAAASAAGAYFLYGSKEAKKNRKKVKGWALKIKGEVLDQLETMNDVNDAAYHKVVDTVSSKYKKLKNVDQKEVEMLAKDLKSHWGNIKKHLNSLQKKTKKKSSKTSKSKSKK